MTDWLTERFEASRPRLRAVAHRLLGSGSEAEDAVQETWIRLARTSADGIDNLDGWLTTVVTRVCLDRLRSRRSRREEAVGARPPEDLPEATGDHDPAEQAVVAESVGAALMLVMDSLAPAERVAFVLHDVFAVPFDAIAEILERSPEAARQLASRARRRVRGMSPTAGLDLVGQRELVGAFLRAARDGDLEGLIGMLAPEVVLRPDAEALRLGALAGTRDAHEVASVLARGARRAQLATVDGVTGLVLVQRGTIRGVIEVTIREGRIAAIDVTADPERIRRLEVVPID